jgi:hypothetical protein
MDKHKEYYKGEGGGFPSSPSYGESCESVFAHGSSVHQKCSNYKLTNLLFGLCRSVWIIGLLAIHPSSHPRVMWAKKHTPTPYPSVVFTFGLTLKSIEVFKGVSQTQAWDFFSFLFFELFVKPF